MQAVFVARTGVGVGLLRINIDGLDRVNDEGGESAGDGVLLELAKFLRRTTFGHEAVLFRASDIAVLLPAASKDDALDLAAEIVESASAIELPDGGSLSLSIGVGHLTVRAGGDPVALLDIADSALRTAKHRGARQIVVQTD
jgi:diguanylate cyclase (GGDEF)-like protein